MGYTMPLWYGMHGTCCNMVLFYVVACSVARDGLVVVSHTKPNHTVPYYVIVLYAWCDGVIWHGTVCCDVT